jgi:methionine synthase II (cobalamin-independent)
LIFGELAEFPHLPELPQRGVGAELAGRGAAILVDLPAHVTASGWRMTANPGHDLRRAQDFLARDLDALELVAGEYPDFRGPLKVQAPGPWTLAAAIEVPSGHRMVADPGATRELAQSLAEGLRLQLADVQRRVPNATLVLQLDEPSLPAVLAGHLPTASGWGTVRAVSAQLAEETLAEVMAVAAPGSRVVHCCASDVPIGLLRGAGADAISLDATLLRSADNDGIGEAVDRGLSIWLGVLPGTDTSITLDLVRAPITRLWNELGFAPELLSRTVVPTPTCGLAGASPGYARRALKLLNELGRELREESG